MSEPAGGGWRNWLRTPVGLGVVALAVLVLVIAVRRGGGGEAGAAFGQQGGDCVAAYPDDLVERDWAFDGVVTGTEPVVMPSGVVEGVYIGVRFDVREWFAGGPGDEVVVAFADRPPDTARLLVSGGGENPLIAGSACGFVRYYDPDVAETWRATF